MSETVIPVCSVGSGEDERRVDARGGELADDHRAEVVGADLPDDPHGEPEAHGVRREERHGAADSQVEVLDQDLLTDGRLALWPRHDEVHVHVADSR